MVALSTRVASSLNRKLEKNGKWMYTCYTTEGSGSIPSQLEALLSYNLGSNIVYFRTLCPTTSACARRRVCTLGQHRRRARVVSYPTTPHAYVAGSRSYSRNVATHAQPTLLACSSLIHSNHNCLQL